MDLIKIGKYISEKRKALGMTQKQLAEKLDMSDKSVSKWERGVCLPDVSIYSELCSALGISVNEFLAGEDIERENLAQKSEENLFGVAIRSKRKQRQLKSIICALIIVAIGCILMLSVHRQVTCVRETIIWQAEPYTVIDSPKLKKAQPNESFSYDGKIVDVYGGEWYRISDIKVGTSAVYRRGYISAEDSKISFSLLF